MSLDLKHLIPSEDARPKGSAHPAAAQEAETAWEAAQGGTGPGSPCHCPRLEQGLGTPSAGGCSQGQRGDGGAIAQRPPAALRGERDEGTRTQTCHAAASGPRQMLSTTVHVPPSSYIATTDLPPARCLIEHLMQTKCPSF